MRFPVLLLALCLAIPARAEPARHHRLEVAGPECLTANEALMNALAHGATAGRLDGDEASRLLAQINEIGDPTDYRAETVILVLRPGAAVVALFNACHMQDVVIRLDAFAEAWRKARGEGV